MQSAIDNAPCAQRAGVPPIKAMKCMSATPPIATFYRAQTPALMTITDLIHERTFNAIDLCKYAGDLHPVVSDSWHDNRRQVRESTSKEALSNFTEGDFVFVACEDFRVFEKLSLFWRGPPSCRKTVQRLLLSGRRSP